MECTESNVSIDKTSKNKVSAVGAEKVSNKSKIFVKSTRSESFRCIMSLSYRVTFAVMFGANSFIHQKAVRYFYEKGL